MKGCIMLRAGFSALERAFFNVELTQFWHVANFMPRHPQRMLGVKSTLWYLLWWCYWMYKL